MKETEKERQMIREATIKTAQKLVQPKAAEIDESGRFPQDLVDAFGKQGFLSLLLPEEYGGTQGDISTFCLVIEEIAKVSGSASLWILAQGVGTWPIFTAGDPSQQERYFTQISEKNSLTALTLSGQLRNSPMAGIPTTAPKKGGDYLLTGCNTFVTHGSVADLYSVFAMTDTPRGEQGISAFVVEKGTAGLRFGKSEEKMGMRGVETTDVIFENCRVPAKSRLREEGDGWEIAGKALELEGVAVGALAVGIAQGALDYAIHYAGERMQFGRSITSFQAIQFMISDRAAEIEAARALVHRAMVRLDDPSGKRDRLPAMAKCFASDVAMRVTTDAVQILGGYGYMKDYPIERMMRDAKVTQIYGGANQSQKLFITEELMKG